MLWSPTWWERGHTEHAGPRSGPCDFPPQPGSCGLRPRAFLSRRAWPRHPGARAHSQDPTVLRQLPTVTPQLVKLHTPLALNICIQLKMDSLPGAGTTQTPSSASGPRRLCSGRQPRISRDRQAGLSVLVAPGCSVLWVSSSLAPEQLSPATRGPRGKLLCKAGAHSLVLSPKQPPS